MGNYQTNTNQQGDVYIYHGPEDRGEIVEAGGIIEMTKRYESMAYLVLLGGNEDDDGSQDTEKKQWWGNEDEPEERQYRGRFQQYLTGAPITSATVPVMEAAALEDMSEAFVPLYASEVIVSLTLLAPKMVRLDINIKLYNSEVVPITLEVAA